MGFIVQSFAKRPAMTGIQPQGTSPSRPSTPSAETSRASNRPESTGHNPDPQPISGALGLLTRKRSGSTDSNRSSDFADAQSHISRSSGGGQSDESPQSVGSRRPGGALPVATRGRGPDSASGSDASNVSFVDAPQWVTDLTLTATGENGTTRTEQVHVFRVDDAQMHEIDELDRDVGAVVDQIIREGGGTPELANPPGNTSQRLSEGGRTNVQENLPETSARTGARSAPGTAAGTQPKTATGTSTNTAALIAARTAASTAAGSTANTAAGVAPSTADMTMAHAAARAALAAAPETSRRNTSIPLSRLNRTSAVEPTHADLLLEHRQVNDVKYLEANLPTDLRAGMSYILNPLRSRFESNDAFEAFVTTQTDTVHGAGVTDRAGLLNLARTVTRRDNLMPFPEAGTGGAHFNLPGLAFTYGPLSDELTAGSAARSNALQGGVSGIVAGLSDATSTPARAATFKDAYYKRPDPDYLPENLRNLNPPNLNRSIGEGAAAWTSAFGASYVARGAVMAATTYTYGPEMAAQVEAAIAPVANIAAGIGAKFITHKLDEREGRTGLPLFFARTNLADCVQASNKSTLAYVGAAATGVATHAKNTVMKFPAGVKAATTDLGLVASTGSLGLGLSMPSTVAGLVQQRCKDPKLGHMLGSITKYVTLDGVWGGWATASAVGAHLQAQRT